MGKGGGFHGGFVGLPRGLVSLHACLVVDSGGLYGGTGGSL